MGSIPLQHLKMLSRDPTLSSHQSADNDIIAAARSAQFVAFSVFPDSEPRVELKEAAIALRSRLAADRLKRRSGPMQLAPDPVPAAPAAGVGPTRSAVSFDITYEQLLRMMLSCNAATTRITLTPFPGGAAAVFPSNPKAGSIPLGAGAAALDRATAPSLELRALDEIGRIAVVRSIKSRKLDLDITDLGDLQQRRNYESSLS